MDKYQRQYQYECEVLGCLIKDPSLIAECNLLPTHFYHYQNSELYKLILAMNGKGEQISRYNVKTQNDNTLFLIGGAKRVDQVVDCVVSLESFSFNRDLIRTFNTIEHTLQIVEGYVDSTKDVHKLTDLQNFIEHVNTLNIETGEKQLSFEQLLIQTEKSHQDAPEKGLSGIHCGFLNLNQMTDGWQPSELIVLGARPSMGKSALTINMIMNSVMKTEDVYATFFSCEMALRAVMNRIISQVSGVQLGKMRNPKKSFTQDDRVKYDLSLDKLKELKNRLAVLPEYKVTDIRTMIRKTIRNNPNKRHIFYIDHLDHVKIEGRFHSKVHEVGEIVHQLKKMAVEFNVPIVLLSQLNRAVEKQGDKRPTMSDLRESGTIEQVADTIVLIYRDEYYDPNTEDKGIMELIIAKHREGPTGKVKLKFNPAVSRITEVL